MFQISEKSFPYLLVRLGSGECGEVLHFEMAEENFLPVPASESSGTNG
jgi:hypothetical protein